MLYFYTLLKEHFIFSPDQIIPPPLKRNSDMKYYKKFNFSLQYNNKNYRITGVCRTPNDYKHSEILICCKEYSAPSPVETVLPDFSPKSALSVLSEGDGCVSLGEGTQSDILYLLYITVVSEADLLKVY